MRNGKTPNDRNHILLALAAFFGLSLFILMPAHGISCPSPGCMQYGDPVNNMTNGMHAYPSPVPYTGMYPYHSQIQPGIANATNHTQTFAGANITVHNPNNGATNAYQSPIPGHINMMPNNAGYKIPPSSKYSIQVTITTDKTAYNYGDPILIAGHVSPIAQGTTLDIVMKGPNSQIQVGQVNVRSDGSFSEQVYASGPQWASANNYYTVTAQYGPYTYSGTTFYFSKAPTSSTLDSTSTTVTSSSATASADSPVTLSAQVSDTSHFNNKLSNFGFHYLPSVVSGFVSWSDNNAGGTFNPASCTPSAGGSCITSYTQSTSPPPTITITASYGGDDTHSTSSGTASLTTNQVHPTSTTITTSNSATISAGSQVTFSAQVGDTSNLPTITTGYVAWSDNGAGGTFYPASCALSSGGCTTSYTASTSPPSTITITASYGGDATHSTSSGTAYLTSQASTSTVDATVTTVTANPATLVSGSTNTLSASVADTSNPSSSVTGVVSWSDNGAGGTFSPNVCAISDNQCALTYTPPSSLPNSITITATYAGDSSHSSSSGAASLTASSTATSSTSSGLTVTTDKPSYNAGNNVTITVYSSAVSSGENVAILVTDPSSNIVASRTIQFNAQGYANISVGLLPNAPNGTYQISASASSNGNYLSGSASFAIPSSSTTSTSSAPSGVTIVSIQPTNQMGNNVVTSYSRGTTGFAKVVISSTSSQSALITVNLVGSDGTSLGVGSIETSLGTGNSQMIVSFYIPSSAAVGTANIYADMFSNWPTSGGTPLAPESSSTVNIQ